jgi:hypothetical protein
LPASNFDDIPWLDISPSDWIKPWSEFDSDHQIFKHFVIDLVCNFSLSQLKCAIPDSHERHVYSQSNHRECGTDLTILSRQQDQDEKDKCQKVFKMINTINYEIPNSEHTLISISIDLI